MNKMDISNWKEFNVSELFDIRPTKHYNDTNGKALPNNKLYNVNGNNPVVVNSAFNNGIGGYSNKDCNEKGGIITFSDTTTADAIFYQEKDFIGYSHVQGMYPIKYKDKWSKYSMKFFEVMFHSRANTLRYNYVNKFTRDLAKKMSVKLPVDNNGEPDWEYMETYMKNVETLTLDKLNNLNVSLNIISQKIDIKRWKKFNLYDEDLFYIDMGTKLDKVKMTENNPTINFVGRANANNGITACIDLIDNIKPYKAGCMTVSLGGEYLGSCFIQPKDFYTSQNVIVLIPKHEMSLNVKQFISTMIFKESRTHYKAFIDELNRHIKTDFSFYLPVKEDNKPDWQYMNDYMEKIKNKCKNILKTINELP